MNTTDTPRTDACPHCGAEQQPISNRAGGMTHDGWICGTRRFLPENIRSTLCLEREARQKAEAEVKRLKANLRRAVEIAEDFLPSGYDGYDETIRTELDQIKATLNPTEK
jgi:hypothetical protein